MFKEWLRDNKIYFETIMTVTLSIMAIVMSLLSYQVSKRQIENDELTNQPLIKISNEFFKYESQDVDDSHFLVIENIGYHLHDFDAEVFSFLKIEADVFKDGKSSNSRRVIYIPTDDYFPGQIPKNNTQGELTKFIGLNNYGLFRKVEEEFESKFSEELPFTFLSLEIYVRLKYSNYRKEQIAELFNVDGVYNGRRIKESDEIRNLTGAWYRKNSVSLSTLRADSIAHYIKIGSYHPSESTAREHQN